MKADKRDRDRARLPARIHHDPAAGIVHEKRDTRFLEVESSRSGSIRHHFPGSFKDCCANRKIQRRRRLGVTGSAVLLEKVKVGVVHMGRIPNDLSGLIQQDAAASLGWIVTGTILPRACRFEIARFQTERLGTFGGGSGLSQLVDIMQRREPRAAIRPDRGRPDERFPRPLVENAILSVGIDRVLSGKRGRRIGYVFYEPFRPTELRAPRSRGRCR